MIIFHFVKMFMLFRVSLFPLFPKSEIETLLRGNGLGEPMPAVCRRRGNLYEPNRWRRRELCIHPGRSGLRNFNLLVVARESKLTHVPNNNSNILVAQIILGAQCLSRIFGALRTLRRANQIRTYARGSTDATTTGNHKKMLRSRWEPFR